MTDGEASTFWTCKRLRAAAQGVLRHSTAIESIFINTHRSASAESGAKAQAIGPSRGNGERINVSRT